jgi:hypothetical protein
MTTFGKLCVHFIGYLKFVHLQQSFFRINNALKILSKKLPRRVVNGIWFYQFEPKGIV